MMLYYQHTEGRVVTAAAFTVGWLVYICYFTKLIFAQPVISISILVLLVALLRYIAKGPVARFLPEGAASPAVFKQRKLADRPFAGRVAVVTGANRNIGWETTRSLSQLGAHVIMIDMEPKELGEAAMAKIKSEDPEASLVSIRLDLQELDTIPEIASEIIKTACKLKGINSSNNSNNNASSHIQPIDFLVNNAGMGLTQRIFTRQGFDKVFQINHLGPYILTEWLLPHINKRDGRIVNTASCAHTWWTLYPFSVDVSRSIVRSLNILNDATIEPYPENTAYALSKFCNLVHATHLAKRLGLLSSSSSPSAQQVKVASYHPGAVWTDIWRFIPYPLKYVSDFFMMLVFKGAYEGHQTALHLLTAPHIINGQFYADCAPFRPRDEALDEKVWDAIDEWTRKSVQKWLP